MVERPGKCPACRRKQDAARPNAYQRGYTEQWNEYSKARLHAYPMCVHELDRQAWWCIKQASVTDHIKPHSGQGDPLFWDPNNHQSMCKPCHDRKTVTEDGGFGTLRKSGSA